MGHATDHPCWKWTLWALFFPCSPLNHLLLTPAQFVAELKCRWPWLVVKGTLAVGLDLNRSHYWITLELLLLRRHGRGFFPSKMDLHDPPFPNTVSFYSMVPLYPPPFLNGSVNSHSLGTEQGNSNRHSYLNSTHPTQVLNIKSHPHCARHGIDLSHLCQSLLSASVPFDYNTGWFILCYPLIPSHAVF